jgi:hypothetical protein
MLYYYEPKLYVSCINLIKHEPKVSRERELEQKKRSQLSDGIHPQWQSDSVLLSKLKASTNFQN